MNRIFIALTLLLASVLPQMNHYLRLHGTLEQWGVASRWTDLVIASAVVAVLFVAAGLRHQPFPPRRGMRILTFAIVLYLLATLAAAGLITHFTTLLAPDPSHPWGQLLPALLASQYVKPFLLVAHLLLVWGVLRVLAHLSTPPMRESAS
jgi:hypothetical protein